MGYKGMCIHDGEWKGVKMVNERDRCVGSTYPKSDTRVRQREGVQDAKTSARWGEGQEGKSKREVKTRCLYYTFYPF